MKDLFKPIVVIGPQGAEWEGDEHVELIKVPLFIQSFQMDRGRKVKNLMR
jgi:hypothetical protein